jgi:endonuclease/exonuclease/phosphatase family metal-dependent hydrolase
MTQGIQLKVMTFNLRFDNPEDGPHAWPLRRELAVRTILEEAPDLLGTQECTISQLQYLIEKLEGYRACIPPRQRDDDPTSQMPTIFYREERWSISRCGEFWLSETPAVYRSKSWEAAFPRLFTHGKFRHLPTGKQLWFANTHLDHVSAQARLMAARMIRGWVLRRRLPLVLVGDFNEGVDGPVHQLLTHGPLRDVWRDWRGCEGPEASTIHHFTGKGQGGRIDWILASRHFQAVEIHLVERQEGFPSDHFPCVSTLRLVTT